MGSKINYYFFCFLFLIAFLLETSFLPQIFFGFFSPNLVAVIVIAAGLVLYSDDFIYLAFGVGLFMDLYTAVNFGIYSLGFTFLSVATSVFRSKFLKEGGVSRIFFITALSILTFDIFTLLLLYFYSNVWLFDFLFVSKKIFFDIIVAIILIFPFKILIYKKN